MVVINYYGAIAIPAEHAGMLHEIIQGELRYTGSGGYVFCPTSEATQMFLVDSKDFVSKENTEEDDSPSPK